MSSREQILKAIKANRPAEVFLPSAFSMPVSALTNLTENFINVLKSIGGNCVEVGNITEIGSFVSLSAPIKVINGIKEIGSYNIDQYVSTTAAELSEVDTLLLKGTIGVAENGAVWLPERNMVNRLLPFICQHLIIAIEEKNIVANMHEAYARIKTDEDGYGVFIAGPSKTADIEQSLVVGAHGPLSLQLFISKS